MQQYIKGQNLLQELQQHSVFDEAKIRQLLSDLLPVIGAVHDSQVIHRDIKPENILRRQSDGKLVLIDFGIAKHATTTAIAKPGTTIGSFGYAPIEQLQRGEAYPASDLYSLGVTCFHLFTHISPRDLWIEKGYSWTYNWRQHVKQPISQELAGILDRLLQGNHEQRYQSAVEVLQDLNGQLPPQPPPSIPFTILTPHQTLPPQPQPQQPTWELLPWVVLAGSGSSLLLIALLCFLTTIWISSGIWLLILGGFFLTQSRPVFEKTYLFIIAVITTLIILFILKRLPLGNPIQAGVNGLLVVVLLTILGGLLAFTIMVLSKLFNKLISRYF